MIPMRYKKVTAPVGGWSEVIFPEMVGYKTACCDCGLVHVMHFSAYEVIKQRKNGTFVARPLNRKRVIVGYVINRDERATAAKRRKRS